MGNVGGGGPGGPFGPSNGRGGGGGGGQPGRDRIAALEAKVALFERIMLTFAKSPVVYMDPRFRDLLDELGLDERGEEAGR